MAAALPDLDHVLALDAADPLRVFRSRFRLPEGVIYLDGNSLGALPAATADHLAHVVADQWGDGLIRSWNDCDWIGAPGRIGDKIGRLIGAAPGEVIVADSTSVNLYKLLISIVRWQPDRTDIIVESGNFPTDHYIASGVADLLGKRLVSVAADALRDAIGPQTAAAVLAHVHYRSGRRHDMKALGRHARSHGAHLIWDLSHSVGAIPLDMGGDGIDLAVGCGYKYLNGGPGAPAFLYVRKPLQDALSSPIAGWMGHATPFAFDEAYAPAPGIDCFLAGTPPMLSLLALESGVDLMLEADAAALFAKSCALFDLFAGLMADHCPELTLISPTDPAERGSHIAFAHPQAYPIVQALIARGVIGDFRTPDVARLGLTPLYLRYRDIWDAAMILQDIMATGAWRDPRFAVRSTVT